MLNLVDRIKNLCDEKNITFAELERRVGISNGQIRRWNTSSPKTENIEKVADFFDVSVDYVLGRTNKRSLTEDNTVQTIAAHHDGEKWTEDELEEIEEFKRFVAIRREARKQKGE